MSDANLGLRMLDAERRQAVSSLQLYLTPEEARELRDQLDALLEDPEAAEHFHIESSDGNREFSCSLLTKRKLSEGRYTKLEREVLVASEGSHSMRIRIVEAVAFGALAAVYYALCAHLLLHWTVDLASTAFSLSVGPALAALWIAGEVVFFLVPFILVQLWATKFDRSGLFAALGVLAAFWLPALISVLGELAFGVPVQPFGGIGGALATWFPLAADLAASVIGLGLVLWSRGRRVMPLDPVAAH